MIYKLNSFMFRGFESVYYFLLCEYDILKFASDIFSPSVIGTVCGVIALPQTLDETYITVQIHVQRVEDVAQQLIFQQLAPVVHNYSTCELSASNISRVQQNYFSCSSFRAFKCVPKSLSRPTIFAQVKVCSQP